MKMENNLTTTHTGKSEKEGSDVGLMSEFCKHLSKSLDLIGYSQEMILFRRETNILLDEIRNDKPFSVTTITTGGKAEGTALYFESDIDRLYSEKGVACVEPSMDSSSPSLLHLDRFNCSPGYTRLKVVRLSETNSILRNFLVDERNELYVVNNYSGFEKNVDLIDINGARITKQDKHGPSVPYGNKYIKYDFVFGIECYSPYLMGKWSQRPRHHGWPDSKLVKQISNLEGHVVPVANTDSRFPRTEWRICYTKAELLLMYSFTEFHMKLYILLKLVAKSVLKPLCSEMSSYIMKNIMFWLIENNPQERFLEPLLIDRLTDAVLFLKECLHSRTLQSYMIVERDLFEGRITEDERKALLNVIDELLNVKKNMLLQRCGKIRIAINKLRESPVEFSKESKKRDQIEKLVYKQNIIFKRTEQPGPFVPTIQERLNQNEMYRQYENDLHVLVIPDSQDIEEQGHNLDDIYRQRDVWTSGRTPNLVSSSSHRRLKLFQSNLTEMTGTKLNGYMIAEKNLFSRRITECERKTLLNALEELLSEKKNMLKRCSKIQQAMSKIRKLPV